MIGIGLKIIYNREMITPRSIMATPSALRRDTFSLRMRTPMTNTHTKLVAVMQGMTDTGTWIRATWLIISVENRRP